MAEPPRARNQAIGAQDAHGSHSENGEVKASVEGVELGFRSGQSLDRHRKASGPPRLPPLVPQEDSTSSGLAGRAGQQEDATYR